MNLLPYLIFSIQGVNYLLKWVLLINQTTLRRTVAYWGELHKYKDRLTDGLTHC